LGLLIILFRIYTVAEMFVVYVRRQCGIDPPRILIAEGVQRQPSSSKRVRVEPKTLRLFASLPAGDLSAVIKQMMPNELLGVSFGLDILYSLLFFRKFNSRESINLWMI
jgi:hypothetical protein